MDKELKKYREATKSIVAKAYKEFVKTPGITEDQVNLIMVAEKTDGWKALAFVGHHGRMNYFEVHRNDVTRETRVVHFPQWTEFVYSN